MSVQQGIVALYQAIQLGYKLVLLQKTLLYVLAPMTTRLSGLIS